MKEKISKEEAEHVAKLANLPLTEAELSKFTSQLSDVIDYNMTQLSKVDISKVEPVTNITGLENVNRADEAAPSLKQEEATKNAKRVHNGLFEVEAILE